MFELPEDVRITTAHAGPRVRAWVAALPRVVDELCRQWALIPGPALDGGKSGLVMRVGTAGGGTVVLKTAPPGPDFAHQVATLTAARGHGYVRVYAHDLGRGAVLLEELGPTLAREAPPVERILDVTAVMLREAWRVPRRAAAVVPPGADKASSLIDAIEADWPALDRPCPERIVTHAVELARHRVAAFDLDACVVVHGDPHPANMLAVLEPRPGAESGYVFVDPDGFLCEPEYDLGVTVRAFAADVLAAGDPVGLVRGWCERLSAATGRDAEAIWQWGYVERVSSGLYLMRRGHLAEGRAFLDSAARLVS